MRQVHSASAFNPNYENNPFDLYKVDVTFAKGDKATVVVNARDPLDAMDQVQLLSEEAVRGLPRYDPKAHYCFYWAA